MTDSAVASVDLVPTAREAALLDRLVASVHNDEQITFLLGSGVSAYSIPRVAGILRLADHYAAGRSDDGGLRRALAQARDKADEDTPIRIYAAYRRVFADWVSGGGFDVIGQQAVLAAYRPLDRLASPLATHGIWQRVDRQLGERVENDHDAWQLPPGIQALGVLVARMAEVFGNQILTTNFDPLVEIAIRSANHHAVSLPMDATGKHGNLAGEDGAVRVLHVHGFWRPTRQITDSNLLHDPSLATSDSDQLIASTIAFLTGDTICVLGCSDWAGTLSKAIAAVAAVRPVQVLWAVHRDDESEAHLLRQRLPTEIREMVQCFPGIDSDRLLPLLARRIGIAVSPRTSGPRHRVRHHSWERQLVSQPDAVPPAEIRGLLLQLERRFGWTAANVGSETPSLLLWPVRLRARASVIHMVQALVAGALASRDMQLVICLDDFGVRESGSLGAFTADTERWIRHTGIDVTPTFVSLRDFVDRQQSRRDLTAAEALLRPTEPWAVARAFYGEHNPSLYSVLAAVKAMPNIATVDELEENAWLIVQALLSKDANRLLTPLTLWSLLHHLLLSSPTAKVMTLGGRDEALFWEQWREAFGLGVGQLYNPFVKSLSHESEMLRWSSAGELRQHLHRTHDIPGWDTEGSYIPWLFQNSVLLPIYLTHQPVPEIGGIPLDSWAAFMAAIEDGAPVLDLLADRATELFLGAT